MKKKNILITAICISAHLPIITFAQYAGGSADGHSIVSKTDVATCTLPTYANISTGGNADGHASVSKTDVAICTLPTYANISTGGNADGHAMLRPLNKVGKDSCFSFISCSINAAVTKDTVICQASTIVLSASGGKYYTWYTGSDSLGAKASMPFYSDSDTTAVFKVKIANDTCSVEKFVKVTVIDSASVSVSGKTVVCSGDSTVLTASGGTNYTWSTGETTASIVVKPTQDDTLTVKIGGICADKTLRIPVTLFKAASSVKITGDTVICNGGSTTLKASGGPNYKWSTGATTETITVNPTQDESYKVVVTNGSCSDSSTITIKVLPALIANAGADKTVCKGSSVQLNGSITGGTEPYSINWFPFPFQFQSLGLDNNTVAQPMFIDTISGTYVLFVSDTNGCTNTDTVNVTVGTLTGTISGNTSLCSGESTTLTASGGTSYSWSTGETTASINLTPSKDSTVSVSITNGASCSASVTVKVNTYPTSVSAGADKTICQGSSVKLDGSGVGTTYSWLPKTGLVQDNILQPTASPITTTKYVLTVANGKCAKTDTVVLTVNPLPNVNAGTDTTIKLGESITLSASGANTYLWKPSLNLNDSTIANPTAKPTITTIYVVIGTDDKGCSSKDSVTITVKEKEGCKEFFIPNAFSPNDNGFNDFLYVRGCLKEVKAASFTIYDRWGKKVFETSDLTKGWDGTYQGKALNTAVFVYYLKATLTTDEVIEQKGNVSLIR